MKVFLLFAVITNNQGYESIVNVNRAEYDNKFNCLIDKAQYKDNDAIKFFCAEKELFNKIN